MALILKRAAELQATGDEPAYSLESIQQIAEQVGIDRKFVADVAATLDQLPGGSSLLGAPSDFRLTRRVERSQAIDEAAILATIRDHLPYGAGEMRAVGDGIEWHAGPGDNKTVVSVRSRPRSNDVAHRHATARREGARLYRRCHRRNACGRHQHRVVARAGRRARRSGDWCIVRGNTRLVEPSRRPAPPALAATH